MARPRAPVIAFLTDFGEQDAYAASMKGVALAILPSARLIDISHAIEPGNILGGALVLEEASKWFPPRSAFVAVVDPGVGTGRRALGVRARGQAFVGPDNGLLWPIIRSDPGARVHALETGKWRLGDFSDTFHGRDVFTPAACWLAMRERLARFGPPVKDPVRLEGFHAEAGPGILRGQVLRVDRFGNLVSSIGWDDLVATFGARLPPDLRVSVGQTAVPVFARTYGEAPAGEPFFLLGSGGRLEIALRDGSAAAALGASRGTPVVVTAKGRRP